MGDTIWEAWNSAIDDTIAIGQFEPLRAYVEQLGLDWYKEWFHDEDEDWQRVYDCPDTGLMEYVLLREYPLITAQDEEEQS